MIEISALLIESQRNHLHRFGERPDRGWAAGGLDEASGGLLLRLRRGTPIGHGDEHVGIEAPGQQRGGEVPVDHRLDPPQGAGTIDRGRDDAGARADHDHPRVHQQSKASQLGDRGRLRRGGIAADHHLGRP